MHVLVTGAAGFIGSHLCKRLAADGHSVRGVDIRLPEFEECAAHEFEVLDLRRFDASLIATRGIELVFHLAANMGGIGFIESHRAEIVRDNAAIDLHVLEAARVNGCRRLFYSSSACVYPTHLQAEEGAAPLREQDAEPSAPERGYGEQKLFTERTGAYYAEDFGLEFRCARFHNCYGPVGTYEGGREKSPAAICRKVAAARDGDAIELWGDGRQVRSYVHVADLCEGILRLTRSDHEEPLNLGTDRAVTVDELAAIVIAISGKRLSVTHDPSRPVGVRARNADLSRMREVLGWEPSVTLEAGLRQTYQWIATRVAQAEIRAARERLAG